MDLKAEFSKVCYKKDAIRIAEFVFHNPDRLYELIELVIDNNKVYSHRAGWTLNTLNAIKEVDLTAFVDDFVNLFLKEETLSSNIRNLLHVFRNLILEDEQKGEILNRCFSLLENPQTEVAIKCLAVETIFRISKHEPFLLDELKDLLVFQEEYSKGAFRATCRKYFKLIEKQKNKLYKD